MHFTPRLEGDLHTAKRPFGYNGPLIEPRTLIALYFTALVYKVLDLGLWLADPNRPIRERIDRLFTCLDRMGSFQGKQLLVSYN